LPPEGPRDEDLLAAFITGDNDAFSALMRRHEDRIFALAVRMTGNRPDALDATQDAFIAAFRQASSFRGDSAFSTWLYRIAINACRDVLRKRGRQPTPEEDPLTTHPPAVHATGLDDAVALRLDVSAALAQLPDEYREAVAMHDLGAIPYEEIARITGVSVGTVKSRISRGRRRLAGLLEQPPKPRASKKR
jgi:RNA polymerase sigma-70 factor (ECF subfamily)